MKSSWCAVVAVVVLSGCSKDAPPSEAAAEARSASGKRKPAASTPSASPSATAAPTASSSADTDAQDPPWVRGLRNGCEEDDDCIIVTACSSYAIRRDAKKEFDERIRGVRFRCERVGASANKKLQAACVDGTCKVEVR